MSSQATGPDELPDQLLGAQPERCSASCLGKPNQHSNRRQGLVSCRLYSHWTGTDCLAGRFPSDFFKPKKRVSVLFVQESKSCNYPLEATKLEGSGPVHIGDLPVRLKSAETSVISSQLVFKFVGGAGSRQYEPVVIVLEEEILDAPFFFRGTSIGDNRQECGIESRAVIHFHAELSTDLRGFIQEAMKPLASTQTAGDLQELEFFSLDGKLLKLDLRYSTTDSKRQCEATARGELPTVAALRASIIRRMIANPRVKANFRDQANGRSWVDNSSVQQSIADLWTIEKESASGMTAAIKDEAETVAAVKTKLVAAYTDARSTRECVFEVLNNCTDSG
mmetsp:Transcript_34735/g.137002  ORF Transcript_34735/g.137002 Transcript_34735/m.137002 type:complete len:336 (-) Transcript_34735:974-1981(-)